MNSADFDALPDLEKQHFYCCEQCGQIVAMCVNNPDRSPVAINR
jgi:hypothetical protein